MSLTGLTDLTEERDDSSVGVLPQNSTKQWSQNQFDFSQFYASQLPNLLSKYEIDEDFPVIPGDFDLQGTTIEPESKTLRDLLLRLVCHWLLSQIPNEGLTDVYETLSEIYRFHNFSIEDVDRPMLSSLSAPEEGQAMLNAYDVAKYFLLLVSEDEGDVISNLKLQKLLYYAQGFSLAIFDKPLFPEKIEAWIHGPVVPEVYHKCKIYGRRDIPYHGDVDLSKFNEDAKELLDEVYEVYGQFSASMLRNFTHEEPPWKDTPAGEEITLDSMKNYFVTQLNGEKQED